jgi:short-subunit dehydrogenase
MDLILVARRTAPMTELASELRAMHGIDVSVFAADLSRPSAPFDIYNHVQEQGSHVDYLINNAGSYGPDLLESRDWAEQQAYLDLMMISVAALCHYFIPPMRQRGFGRVLNVASVAGLILAPGDYSYGPTKAYLIALAKSLNASFHDEDVTVMALCPGFTHTDFHASRKLTEMKAQTPGFLWYDVDVVVREGLAALEKGKSIYTSGRLYRFLVPILKSWFGRYLLSAMNVKRGPNIARD